MKKFLTLIIFLLPIVVSAQSTMYYKGEWSVPDKQDLFCCTCKIMIAENGDVDVQFVWVYKAIDSTDDVMLNLYRGKKDNSGIEHASGHYDQKTHDLQVTGFHLEDPRVIIAMAKYYLKL